MATRAEQRCKARACRKVVVLARDERNRWQMLDPSVPVYEVDYSVNPPRCRRLLGGAVAHYVTCEDLEGLQTSRRRRRR